MVEDVEATIEWYERVLDANVAGTVPKADSEEELWWAQVMIDDVSFVFQQRASLETEHPSLEGATLGGSLTFYIDVNDADGLRDRLKTIDTDTELETVQELHDTDDGRREFAMQDCNSYISGSARNWSSRRPGETRAESSIRRLGSRARILQSGRARSA